MFRLVYPGVRDSFYNTAIDHVLVNRIENGRSDNTIVITEWQPTVSVSSCQSIEKDIDLDACRKRGITCVRRYGPGKSVYLDEGYIVLTLLMTYYRPGRNVKDFRTKNCQSVIDALKRYSVPVSFHQPDNIVINRGDGRYSTLGNAGQRGYANSLYLQSAVRYEMTDGSFENIIDTLRVDGEPLHEHRDDARSALASVTEFLPKEHVSKEKLAEAIAESFAASFGDSVGEITSHFTAEEEREITEFANQHTRSQEWLTDLPSYKSRGICHFFLAGVNLLPKMRTKIIPASTVSESLDH